MAATISVNFATEQDVYDENVETVNLRTKRSVSAKLLQDVLGGGVVSGGYVQRTGSTMTGYLTLTSVQPINPYHAAPKSYVDSHAYTRRYYYECRTPTTGSGMVSPGATVLSGSDIYNNFLFFFERGDELSLRNISTYLDVYRDGILQSLGPDYSIINNFGGTGVPGTTAIRFTEPFDVGSTFQINIGNIGAFPVTFGVNGLSGGNGIRFFPVNGTTSLGGVSGNLVAYIKASDFAASSNTVALSTEPDEFVSPRTLSAHPLVPRAIGLYQKNISYNNVDLGSERPNQTDPYGSASGEFLPLISKKITKVISDPTGVDTPTRIRAEIERGVFTNTNYNALVTINTNSYNPDDVVFATVNTASKTLTSFDFFVYDSLGSPPFDVYEISIMVY